MKLECSLLLEELRIHKDGRVTGEVSIHPLGRAQEHAPRVYVNFQLDPRVMESIGEELKKGVETVLAKDWKH